jgi:excisionase family DNA binding protein
MSEIEKLYSVRDAARLLGGLSTQTLYNWAIQGKIQRVKVGFRLMFAESELRRIIAEGTGPVPNRPSVITEERDGTRVA